MLGAMASPSTPFTLLDIQATPYTTETFCIYYHCQYELLLANLYDYCGATPSKYWGFSSDILQTFTGIDLETGPVHEPLRRKAPLQNQPEVLSPWYLQSPSPPTHQVQVQFLLNHEL